MLRGTRVQIPPPSPSFISLTVLRARHFGRSIEMHAIALAHVDAFHPKKTP
jgi:hypothetical protein